MKKRAVCLLCAMVLLLGATTACGDSKSEGKTSTTTAAPTTTGTQATTKPQYYVTATKLNVRSAPSTEGELLGQLTYGTPVEILESLDGWYRISYGGMPAYVSSDYVSLHRPPSTTTAPTTTPTTATPIPPNTVCVVTATKLNVRSAPNTTAGIMGTLLQGSTVTVLRCEDGWAAIPYEGATAYVSAQYLMVQTAGGTQATTPTTKAPSAYPDASVPPLQGGLTEEERAELYDALEDIIAENGANYQDVYDYVHANKTYRNMAEGESIEQMALRTLQSKSVSCYYFAAFTYLLMQEAGYEVEFVRGLGWQNGTEHCWIMFKEPDGWYFMDSLYVRSAKLTAKQCRDIGYKWNPTVHPEAN